MPRYLVSYNQPSFRSSQREEAPLFLRDESTSNHISFFSGRQLQPSIYDPPASILILPLYILDQITKIWVVHHFALNGPR